MSKEKNEDLIFDDIDEDEDLSLDSLGIDSLDDSDDDTDIFDDSEEFENSASLAKVWLDTEAHLKKILLYLENKQIAYDKDENPYLKQIKGTIPRCNRLGVYDIMTALSVLSKDLVQANLDKDHYGKFMSRNIRDIGRDIVINRKNWEMSHENMRRIRRLIINNFELFFTRTIGDKERGRFNKNPNVSSVQQDNGFLGKAKRLFS